MPIRTPLPTQGPTLAPHAAPVGTPAWRAASARMPEGWGRWLALALVAAIPITVPDARAPALGALVDAYVAVTVFVAATLIVLFALERRAGTPLSGVLARHRRFEVPIAAGLGALPGCGGVIAVIAQYTRGQVSFGGVVAALTATMGDAMFVLLAADPKAAASVLSLGAAVGVASGLCVDAMHGPDFLRPPSPGARGADGGRADVPMRRADRAWLAVLVPGLVMGAGNAFQAELPGTVPVGAAGGGLALAMWARRGGGGQVGSGRGLASVINDTNFVTAWVFFAFLGFELAVALFDLDVGAAFAATPWIVPLIAILVGFIPGCGPQIVVTGLYVSGAVPLSAQLGNAVSNDGDALFPALAIMPRAALVATLYSAVPALALAYGWFLAFEVG